MKTQLAKYINWYPSSNSEAHITLLEFKDDAELNTFLHSIETFCANRKAQSLRFNIFDYFSNGTFFAGPDEYSKMYLKSLIQDFCNHLGLATHFYPHMTIGRKLHERNQMERTIAFLSNATVDFSFICESVVLRKFDSDKEQYSEIHRSFPFQS